MSNFWQWQGDFTTGSGLVNITGSITVDASRILIANRTSASVTGAGDVLTADYTATANFSSYLMIMTDTSGILYLEVDTKQGKLNSGVALSANTWYGFDIPMINTGVYNLQLSATATVQVKWIGGV